MAPVRFARSDQSKRAARWLYGLGGVLGGILVGMFLAMPVALVAEVFKVRPEITMVVSAIAFASGFAAAARWAVKNYHRRAAMEVIIFDDRVTVNSGQGRIVVPFEGVREIRLRDGSRTGRTCLVVTDSGHTVVFPAEVASFEAVENVLVPRLKPFLEKKLNTTLNAGDAIDVREDVPLSYVRIIGGVVMLCISPMLVIAGKKMVIQTVDEGMRSIRRGFRGRHGGFVIVTTGMLPANDLQRLPIIWTELTLDQLDDDGIVISGAGHLLSASAHARDFQRASGWLVDRLRRKDHDGSDSPVPIA